MKKILRIGKGVKVIRARVKEICELPLNVLDVDMKTELIQALIAKDKSDLFILYPFSLSPFLPSQMPNSVTIFSPHNHRNCLNAFESP